MGFPLSDGQVLRWLTGKGDGAFHGEMAQRRLCAFILFDPQLDPDFLRGLEWDFREMDRRTGRHFLFFAVCQPRHEEDLSLARYFSGPLRARRDRFLNMSSIRTLNFAAAAELGVPMQELPCIVVAESLLARHCWACGTDSGRLMQQILELDAMAEHLHSGGERGGSLQLVLRLGCDGSPWIRLPEGPRNIAARLLHCWRLLEDDDYQARWRRNLQSDLAQARRNDSRDASDEDEGISERISNLGARMAACAASGRDLAEAPEFAGAGQLERGAAMNLRAARLCLDALSDAGMQEDFSAAAICAGKAFEIEARASMAQWIRSRHDIGMPDYFCRWKPGTPAVEVLPPAGGRHREERVDFNKAFNRRWSAPTVNRIREAFFRRDENNDTAKELREFSRDARAAWNVGLHELLRLRNTGAHERELSREEGDQALAVSGRLLLDPVFGGLLRMKSNLRGQQGRMNQPIGGGD